jgi:hypothetical protein
MFTNKRDKMVSFLGHTTQQDYKSGKLLILDARESTVTHESSSVRNCIYNALTPTKLAKCATCLAINTPHKII